MVKFKKINKLGSFWSVTKLKEITRVKDKTYFE